MSLRNITMRIFAFIDNLNAIEYLEIYDNKLEELREIVKNRNTISLCKSMSNSEVTAFYLFYAKFTIRSINLYLLVDSEVFLETNE